MLCDVAEALSRKCLTTRACDMYADRLPAVNDKCGRVDLESNTDAHEAGAGTDGRVKNRPESWANAELPLPGNLLRTNLPRFAREDCARRRLP